MLTLVALSLVVAVPVPDRPMMPDAGWVGKTIFVRITNTMLDPAAEPREPSPMDGSGVPANAIQYRVFAERANHVQVRSRQGTSGWLRKDQVVLLEDAVAFFTKRLDANPNDMDALTRRASAWRAKGELDAAITDATAAIRLNPHAVLYNNRAIIYHAKKDYDKAIADYAQALSMNPQYSLAYVNRATMWHAKKEYDQAIADSTRAIQIDPRYPAAYRIRGVSWHAKKEYDKAIDDLGQTIQLDPKSAQAYTDRASALARKKEYAKAHADFNEAQRLDRHYVPAVAALAFWLASCPEAKYRDGSRALDLAKQAHEQERNNAKAMESLAAAHAELGRFDDAVRWQQRALQDPALKNEEAAQRRLEQYRKKQAHRDE